VSEANEKREWSVVSGQWSVKAERQWSVVSGQWSVKEEKKKEKK
jgi:hypothetical protein